MKLQTFIESLIWLHNIIQVKENMFSELCARNYTNVDELVDVVNSLFKTHYMKVVKSYIWIVF